MHPQLIDFGKLLHAILGGETAPNLPLHTFGVLMGAGFIAGIAFGMREARRWAIDSEFIFNMSFWVMLGGIAGSRLLYVIIDLFQQGSRSAYLTHPLSILAIWEGGLVWYGGFFGAFAFAIFYCMREKVDVLRMSDVAGPATFMGLALGRLGCTAVGDDFGRPIAAEWFKRWGLVFTDPAALVYPEALKGQPLHATQLYMALGAFTLFVILWFTLKHKRFHGQVTFLAFMLYPISRSIVEYFRGDFQRGYVIKDVLSTSQAVSIPTFLAGLILFIVFWKRAKQREVTVKGQLAKSSS